MFVFDTKIATVRPYLLLGSAQHEHDYAMLREAGVTHILQVGSELRPSFPERFEYLRISIDDLEQEDIIRPLWRCFAFIDKARHRDDGDGSLGADEAEGGGGGSGAIVFVHCMAGMSRSASVVLAYLMSDEHLPYVEAFKQVKAARPCIYPNLGFLLQLWEWEAAGCDLDAWPGWGRARFAERLAEYRRAQDAAGLHRAVRVRLPMSPGAASAAAAAAAGDAAATHGAAGAAATAATTAAADAGGRGGAADKANGEGAAAVGSSSCGRCVGGNSSDGNDGGEGDGDGGGGSNVIRIGADSSSYHVSSEAGGDGGSNICCNLAAPRQ